MFSYTPDPDASKLALGVLHNLRDLRSGRYRSTKQQRLAKPRALAYPSPIPVKDKYLTLY